MFDAHKNFATTTVLTAPSPATSGTSLIVAAGTGALFPTAPFSCTVWPSGTPTSTTAEIIRVTAVVGDVLTIVRAQESTTARAIASGWKIANTMTVKVFSDIESAMIQSISAGTSNAIGSQVVFSNSNGVSFGASGSVVTASVAAAGGGLSNINFSAGTTSNNLSALTFSNSNGVSFGLNGSVVTGSHNAITSQSVQTQGAVSINGSTGAIVFSNSNNVSFGGAGSVVTASASFAGAGGVALSAGTQSNSTGTIVFSNSNGITFGMSNSSIVTAAHNALTSQSAQAASASNGSFTFQTLGFSNANNVTFGTSAGSIITASVATAAAGNSVNFSAGTTSNNLGSIVFSNTNGVTFGLDGATITASVATAAGGAGAMLSFFESPVFNNDATSYSSAAQNTIYFDPLTPSAALSFTNIIGLGSWNALGVSSSTTVTGQHGLTRAMAAYSRSVTDSAATNFSNSNNWVTMWTQAHTVSAFLSATGSSISLSFGYQTDSTGGSASTSYSSETSAFNPATIVGQKLLDMFQATSMSAGEYLLAHRHSSSTAGAAAASSLIRMSSQVVTMMTANNFGGGFNIVSNGTSSPIRGLGVFSATSAAFPASVHTSQFTNFMNRRLVRFVA